MILDAIDELWTLKILCLQFEIAAVIIFRVNLDSIVLKELKSDFHVNVQ